jgi:hypothetical protein
VTRVYSAAPAWLPLAEPPPEPLSEAELSHIWAGRRFPVEALATPDGRPVRVLNPGHSAGGSGPDFRDAVVLVGGERRLGDVELHVRASSFREHGHDRDPAYDGVVLHVVYRADDGPDTALCSRQRVPVAAFAPWVERRTADLRAWLEQPSLWQAPCRAAEANHGDAMIREILAEAGRERFRARRDELAAAIDELGAETAFWRALVEALGYGGDRDGFRRFAAGLAPADLLPWRAAPVEDLAAALIAAAGLTPADETSVALPRLKPGLERSAGRPANRPERRLTALAHLYRRAGGKLSAYALAVVREGKTPKALVAAWSVGAGGRPEPAPIGRGRGVEIVVNVILPFAVALEPLLAPKAAALLAALPAQPAYGKTAFLERNLRRSDGRRRVRSVVEQQGLLAFSARWCSRDGCGRCPLS